MILREHYYEIMEEGRYGVARLLGTRIDEQSFDPLKSQLTATLRRCGFRLLLKLEDIEYLPSRMLAIIVQLHNLAKSESGFLCLCELQDTVRKTFEVTQFHKILNVFENEADARRFLERSLT